MHDNIVKDNFNAVVVRLDDQRARILMAGNNMRKPSEFLMAMKKRFVLGVRWARLTEQQFREFLKGNDKATASQFFKERMI